MAGGRERRKVLSAGVDGVAEEREVTPIEEGKDVLCHASYRSEGELKGEERMSPEQETRRTACGRIMAYQRMVSNRKRTWESEDA